MALAVTCSKVTQRGGKVYLSWSDGTQLEFGSVAEAREYVAPLQNDPDTLKRLFIAAFLTRSPNGTNVAVIEGKTLTLELDAANLLQLLRIT